MLCRFGMLIIPLSMLLCLPQNCKSQVIKISWGHSPEEDISHYVIYKGQRPEATTQIAQVPPTDSTFFDFIFEESDIFYYRVAAVDSAGNVSDLSHAGVINLIKKGDFELSANYPNPFNPETHFSYTIAKNTEVNLVIFNYLGQKVKTLVSGNLPPGTYHVTWDGRNDVGNRVASGMYFVKMSAGGFQKVRQLLLQK